MTEKVGSNEPFWISLFLIMVFFVLAIFASYNHPENLVELGREEWRQEADLKAQRDMAMWALWMSVMSGVGVLVGGAGLYFLKRTFDETRRIGNAQLIPYLTVSGASIKRIMAYEGASHFQLHCSVEFSNSGQTPAMNVTNVGMIGWRTEKDVLGWCPSSEPSARTVVGPSDKYEINKRLHTKLNDIETATLELSEKSVWARGTLVYQDFTEQWWELSYLYRFKEPTRFLEEGRGKTMTFGMTPYLIGNSLKKINPPHH